MRSIIALATLAALASPVAAEELDGADAEETSLPAGQFADQYRFGGTYETIRTATASNCDALCSGDANCRAWSFTLAGAGVAARCELKQVIGSAEYRPGTISGVSRRVLQGRPFAAAKSVEPVQASVQPPLGEAPEASFKSSGGDGVQEKSAVTKAVRSQRPAFSSAGAPIVLTEPTASWTPASRSSQAGRITARIRFEGDPDLLTHIRGSYAAHPTT